MPSWTPLNRLPLFCDADFDDDDDVELLDILFLLLLLFCARARALAIKTLLTDIGAREVDCTASLLTGPAGSSSSTRTSSS